MHFSEPGDQRSVFKVVLVMALLVALPWGTLRHRLKLNRIARRSLMALSSDPQLLPLVEAQWASLSVQDCRANWLRGLVANRLGWEANRDASWEAAIRCSSGYVSMLHAVVPDNQGLAELSVREHPKSAEALFWLAQIRARRSPEEAIELYQQGLQREPHDGLRWRELGDLLASRDPSAAMEAYLQSCYNSDPGYHGCYGAGMMAERLGDLEAAILYYRLSQWSGSLDRADELEKQRREETAP